MQERDNGMIIIRDKYINLSKLWRQGSPLVLLRSRCPFGVYLYPMSEEKVRNTRYQDDIKIWASGEAFLQKLKVRLLHYAHSVIHQ